MRYALLFCCFLMLCSPAIAEDALPADSSFETRRGWVFEFDPADQPYPDYVADPRRPRMSLGFALFDTDIPDTSSGRAVLDAGTRYTLFKITDPKGINDFALDIEGCLFTQFDTGNQLDNVGWDGLYGLFLVYDWRDTITVRYGYRHLSAHLGDEYIESTGRKRVGYTREDFAFGLCYQVNNDVQFYIEPSYAFHIGNNARQERWAVEGGFQYQGPHDMWNNSTAYYAGIHFRSFQETGWNLGTSVQGGFYIKRSASSSNCRIGVEAYTGRAILGEFALDYDESYVLFGVMFDFY
ncbi:MAG: DUF1207 domain-containing protein [Desulfobacteraceae bacterium]|nr:DUF1207 domain-containing protein [Desulfobacteraceae bacterium]MBC2757554.1 DUF1207 domain-containing protein [Desulfobacteraceae bacterium]